ncbi:MAG: TonB-dependent receptor [Microscillaceae bacterium]|nr:TonB-dependent receptor [Microscillaceae bacterium]
MIKLENAQDRQGIEGVFAQIFDKNRNTKIYVSDSQGKIFLESAEFPLIIRISHLNFEIKSDTLPSPKDEHLILLTPKNKLLDEIIITGQYTPESVQNSVYKARIITATRIKAQGANHLQDVLSTELNIRFARDNAVGGSNLSLQGLSGQNIKILLDGVPLTGRSGTANEIDINQINVNSIEQIEIIEGPMAVNYGADALAGVINIISKKDISGKIDLNLSFQEESVGNEFSWFEDGIHNPSLSIGYKPRKHWYIQGEGQINRFGGWQGDALGREKSWYPKTQYFGSTLVRFEKTKWNLYYRLDYLNELIENLGAGNDNNPLRDPFAIDEEYQSHRWMHQLQGEFKLGKAHLNSVVSFTDYERNTNQFVKNLVTDQESPTGTEEQDYISYQNYFTRQTLNNALQDDWVETQFGLEANHEIAGGTTLSEGNKSLTDLAFFASAELTLIKKIKLRPGMRYGYNNAFSPIPTPSLNVKYDLNPQLQLRAAYGRGFRAPSVRELYHEFIDANHNIIGNKDLEAEKSHNLNADLSYKLPKIDLSMSINGFYNYVDNRITYFTPEGVNQPTTYTNLLKYKTTGGQLNARWQGKNLLLNAGFAYLGRYQRLSEAESEGEIPQYVFSPELNANAIWQIPTIHIQLSGFYKYTGANKAYTLIDEEPVLQKINAFHWLDFTASKSFWGGLTLAAGVRNILNVTQVNNNISSSGAHSGNSGGQSPVAYGRSFFLKLHYQLNIQQKNNP